MEKMHHDKDKNDTHGAVYLTLYTTPSYLIMIWEEYEYVAIFMKLHAFICSRK